MHTRHLVVGADKPIGRQRHRQRPPDDEAVIARSARCDEARLEIAGQVIEHGVRRLARGGTRPVKRQAERGGVGERARVAVGQRTQPCAGDPACLVEEVIGHAAVNVPQRQLQRGNGAPQYADPLAGRDGPPLRPATSDLRCAGVRAREK